MPDSSHPRNVIESFFHTVYAVLETPVVFVRGKRLKTAKIYFLNLIPAQPPCYLTAPDRKPCIFGWNCYQSPEKIVVPNQKNYPWYHQKFRRVPNIDQCETDDLVCYSEANIQYKRDRLVESEIIHILRQRFENCVMYETPDHLTKCKHVLEQYRDAETNWFIKCKWKQ